MQNTSALESSGGAWTLKKAVTTLAIAPQTESITRSARMAYNVMIFKAQRMKADVEGGYSSPLSEIIKGFGVTTRDSSRIRAYIEQMCTTLVRWFPLSASDDAQASVAGLEPATTPSTAEDGRVFTLLSEARFSRRSGEQWVTWFFPPTIRDMVIEPSRWAELDIKEMSALSHYAGVALYEICGRYKDVPGGLTNRADPVWWVQALRQDPETKQREWRKFKNETLKPAINEISARTSLQVELLEYKQGRAIVQVQFRVRRKAVQVLVTPVDLSLVEQAGELGIKERELDALVDEHGEEKLRKTLAAMQGRQRAQPTVPIKHPLAYLRHSLRNGGIGPLFDPLPEPVKAPSPIAPGGQQETWLSERHREISDRLDNLSDQELERYVALARATMINAGVLSTAMLKRLDAKQYRAPMIWTYVKAAYATEIFGANWKTEARTANS